MKNKITRRDFLNGTQLAIGASMTASLLPNWTNALADKPSDFVLPDNYYPPLKSGFRGSHAGSWETMHARVSGTKWDKSAIEEEYDLVVVGAGLSGLSAAHFYRKNKPDAKILILDNHDDFGGHAKRNEFNIDGQMRMSYGGTESIDTPSSYSQVAKELLVDIGIDVQKFYKAYHHKLYPSHNMSKGILFDKKVFGKEKLVVGYGKLPWEEFINQTPLSEKAKKDFCFCRCYRL